MTMDKYERQMLINEVAERAAAKTKDFVEAAAEGVAESIAHYAERLALVIFLIAATSLYFHALGPRAQTIGAAIFLASYAIAHWRAKQRFRKSIPEALHDGRVKLRLLLEHFERLENETDEKRIDANFAREVAEEILFPMINLTRDWRWADRRIWSVLFPAPMEKHVDDKLKIEKWKIEAMYGKYCGPVPGLGALRDSNKKSQ